VLQRASVAEVKAGGVSKADAHLVVTMRVYPRFLSKDLIHEYAKVLAPEAGLFGRYRDLKKRLGQQDQAFHQAHYEQEFALSADGMSELERLATLSSKEPVRMICQCDRKERCHVDLMLLLSQALFAADIGELPYAYPIFRERLPTLR
jgi:uncharacterized protein YeaO (DUF488 family)